MNQAMRRPLRIWHLLLLVPLLLASPPAASQALPAGQTLAASGFRVEFLSAPVAGTWTSFNVIALGSDGRPLELFTGIVSVTVSGPGAAVDPSTHTYLPVVDKGVKRFEARWFRAAPEQITVTEVGGITYQKPVTVVAGPATQLYLQLPQGPVPAGTRVTAKVTAWDANNNRATDFTGPIRFTSTDPKALLPPASPLDATNNGEFLIEFRTATPPTQRQALKVFDARASPTLQEDVAEIGVMPGPLSSFLPTPSVQSTTAGEPFDVTVEAIDMYGNRTPYTGSVQFSSVGDDEAVLPGPISVPGSGSVTLKKAGARTVTITGANSITGRLDMQVSAAEFYQTLLSTSVNQAVDACTSAVVRIRAVDRYENLVLENKQVTLCGEPSQALEYTGHTLSDARSEAPGCITGRLSFNGEGQVSWSNKGRGSVRFSEEFSNGSTATLTWQEGGFSPKDSRLSFPGATESPPGLRTFTGELPVLFELLNACKQPVEAPAGRSLSFRPESPLILGTPAAREAPGRWSATVRLPKCPDTGDALLKLWPTLDGELIPLPISGQLQAEVRPHCLPPDVQLELRARPEDAKATPGAQVEFEVTVSNTGPNVIPAGQLWLETEALTAREARLGDEPFVAVDSKLALPALEPGATKTVKIRGQAAVRMDVLVKLTTWYTTVESVALTEQKSLSLEWDELAVDVGCGCQTGSLPSQFLPWLALLAAASRSRSRLRRLTRGERNDR